MFYATFSLTPLELHFFIFTLVIALRSRDEPFPPLPRIPGLKLPLLLHCFAPFTPFGCPYVSSLGSSLYKQAFFLPSFPLFLLLPPLFLLSPSVLVYPSLPKIGLLKFLFFLATPILYLESTARRGARWGGRGQWIFVLPVSAGGCRRASQGAVSRVWVQRSSCDGNVTCPDSSRFRHTQGSISNLFPHLHLFPDFFYIAVRACLDDQDHGGVGQCRL